MDRKVVLVTGSSKGIGAATIKEFAKNGYNVVINYHHSVNEALSLKEYVLEKYDVDAIAIKCDITQEIEVQAMIKQIIDKFGHIDVLVNNAGIAIDTLVEDKTIDDFKMTINTNLIGAFICSRECYKYMNEKSSIIMVSSTNGLDTYYPYSLDYDASKAGLISLMHNLAVEYSPKIRVNAVAPGWVNTEMNQNLDADYVNEECKNILLNRFAEPEEIADVIYFLASDKAKYINNEVIRVDGGQRC